MLEALWIENFLTISHLEIDFDRGFTALTGETGAGKSMLMEGLQLAIGGRAETSLIRPQAQACEISATFIVQPESAAFKWANDQGLDVAEGEWILTRQLNQSGRSKAYLNGKPVPLQLLKTLGEQLVHVHGQHAHYALLQGQAARLHVDRYGAHQALLNQVEVAFDLSQQIKQQLSVLGEMQEVEQRLSFLNFQKEELVQLKLSENEIEQLSFEHKRLHHVKDYLQSGQALIAKLNDEYGLSQQLHEVQSILRQLPHHETQVQTLSQLLEEADIQIKEAASEAQAWVDSLTIDPDRLTYIESRMSELHQAARKYRVEVKALPEVLEKFTQEVEALEAKLKQQPALLEQLQQIEAAYQQAAHALRAAREKIAPELAAGMTAYMKELGMPHGRMEISFSDTSAAERHGLDRLNYEVSTNPGMPPSLLSKVASGGELSRISLAIELMTAERSTTPILLFDEVDVGIGGNTAAVVGRLMRQLGERVQVFCVTHQPQVAACAHHHVRIEKQVENQQVYTQAQRLTQPGRIEELARMLGGVNISEQAMRHAEALLEEMTH